MDETLSGYYSAKETQDLASDTQTNAKKGGFKY